MVRLGARRLVRLKNVWIEKFLFDKNSTRKRIEHLSPGERERFAFSIFAYNDYDPLILDEPDNQSRY